MEFLDGDTVDHLIPCTASEKQTCQIVTKLATWNKMLWGSRFEIREQPETSNQLRIWNYPITSPTAGQVGAWKQQQQADLLRWLLATHKCIGSVSLNLSLANDTGMRLLRAVCQNKWIRTIEICGIKTSAASTVSATLPCLTNIETLHLTSFKLFLDAFIDPLCTLLQASSSLRCLHLSGEFARDTTIDMLFTALLRKPALEELRIQGLSINRDACRQAPKEYLSLTTALKVLSVTARNLFMQRAILEGVLKNRSIEKLLLYSFVEDEESTVLVSRIIKENLVIRVLHIWTAQLRDHLVLNSVYDCWVTPLIENSVLEEVGLSYSILYPTTWSVFFRALPTKESLKVVHISLLSQYSNLQWFCAELKCSGCEGKVSFGHHQFTGQIDLLDCKAFSGADFPLSATDGHKLAVLRRLPTYEHVKYIGIWIQSDYMSLSLALAEYLRSTTALQSLDLGVMGVDDGQAHGQQQWWNIILESLAQNKSVKELEIRMFGMSIQDTEDLADSLKRNTCIRWLHLANIAPAHATAFFRCLSDSIEDNYTLMRVNYGGRLESDHVSHWLAVRATTLRNFGLVARAARMKEASHLDRYVTAALERVLRHPALLDEVARWTQLDQAELVVLARDRLRRTQSLDGFMQVAGVVKEQVVCHPVDDGRLQMDDLNEDCWSHVRRYLSTDDVMCVAVQDDNV
ncbi:hypothetical protein MTO96_043195 [Rhipicephalus appendiculatus]